MTAHVNLKYYDLPNYDEFAMQELGESLEAAASSKRPITLMVFKIGEVTGVIEKMDSTTRKIHLQTEEQGLFKIPFLEIWSVEDPAD